MQADRLLRVDPQYLGFRKTPEEQYASGDGGAPLEANAGAYLQEGPLLFPAGVVYSNYFGWGKPGLGAGVGGRIRGIGPYAIKEGKIYIFGVVWSDAGGVVPFSLVCEVTLVSLRKGQSKPQQVQPSFFR